MGAVHGDRPARLSPVVVLGATGSIGRQALDVAESLGLEVRGIAARSGSAALLAAADRHPDALVAAIAPSTAERQRVADHLGRRARFGPESLVELATLAGCTVLNGVVGAAGLPASVGALEAGNRLALANKESLVAAGPLVLAAAQRGGGELVPVDSEHSALAQCLLGEDLAAVRRIVLSASGGPFRGRAAEDLAAVTVAEALAHPTWRMGRRITIDSATLMNKGFEVIEAHHLFGIGYDRIDVVVHPQSIVHSLVEFVDGSLKAHLGEADMRIPIQWAITGSQRRPGRAGAFRLAGRALTFEDPDEAAFPCLRLAYEAGRTGDSAPAVLNAADEVAVRAFLDGRIGFTAIPEVVERTLESVPVRPITTIGDVHDADREARAVAASWLGGSC